MGNPDGGRLKGGFKPPDLDRSRVSFVVVVIIIVRFPPQQNEKPRLRGTSLTFPTRRAVPKRRGDTGTLGHMSNFIWDKSRPTTWADRFSL